MERNVRLETCMVDADVTNAELARTVNELAWVMQGVRLGHDKSSVSHWRRGRLPNRPTPELIATALSRRLGYEVTIETIGMLTERPGCDTGEGLTLADSPQVTLELVDKLSEQDMRRRDFLAASGFVAAAFAQPSLYAVTFPAELTGSAGAGRQIGGSDVEVLRDQAHSFRKLDQRHGGAQLRRQVVNVVQKQVAAARHASYTQDVGRNLFSVLAELTCLAGYLTLDSGQYALAQRYYVQALGLARHADDTLLSSYVLGCMSYQATYLGRGRDGVALARAAQIRIGDQAVPGANAMFKAFEARGYALLGEERASTVALSAAEKELNRPTFGEDISWMAFFNEAELAAHAAHCLRDLGKPARGVEPHVTAAVEGFGASCVRSRAFVHTVLATAHLATASADVDAACHEANKALDLVRNLRSERARKQVIDFARLLQSKGPTPASQDFMNRAEMVLRPKTRGISV